MDWPNRAGSPLTLRDLRILLATVEAGSVSRAAAKLRVSQPAVSKTIAQMERALGAPLLVRSSRGVAPTPQGAALIIRGRNALRELQAGLTAMNDGAQAPEGELRIAGNQVALSGLLPAVIERLSARHPGIIFHVVPTPTFADQLRVLEEGHAELVIGRVDMAAPGDRLRVVELFPDDFVVVAGRSSRWTRRKKIALGELLYEPWAFPEANTATGHHMIEIFRANGLAPPHPSVAASSLQLHQWLVAESNFLALFPRSLASSAENLRVLPVDFKQEARSIVAMSLKHRTLGRLARMFVEVALEEAGRIFRSHEGAGAA